jgi:hypothetical protein
LIKKVPGLAREFLFISCPFKPNFFLILALAAKQLSGIITRDVAANGSLPIF